MEGVEYVEQDGLVHAMQGVGSWGLDRVDQRGATLDNRYSYTSKIIQVINIFIIAYCCSVNLIL